MDMKKNPILKKTLKDLDFNHIEKYMFLSKENKLSLIQQIEKDVDFFYKTKIIDYSLLLGVIDLDTKNEEELKIIEQLESEGRLFRSTME